MKKILLIIISIIVFIFVVIFCVNFLATNKNDKSIDTVRNAFIINNENIDEVTDVYIYSGDKTYYIIKYLSDNKKYISVLDNSEVHYIDTEEDKLANIDEIKDKEYVIGYKYDKLIYEVKEEESNGFSYLYYDALTGELIKKIELNK